MPVNLGLVSAGQKVVVFDHYDLTKVRKYYGTGGTQWVSFVGATFSQCAVSATVIGDSSYAVVSSLPNLSVSYPLRIYESSASDFTDPFVNASFIPPTVNAVIDGENGLYILPLAGAVKNDGVTYGNARYPLIGTLDITADNSPPLIYLAI